jgi:hypothetical protein
LTRVQGVARVLRRRPWIGLRPRRERKFSPRSFGLKSPPSRRVVSRARPTPLPAASAKFRYNAWSFSESRVDLYFPMPAIETVGIKLRGRKFEIKWRRGVDETIDLCGEAASSVELWDKWSFDAPIVQQLRQAMM